jgi:altronate dehydratase small subunit
MNITNIIHGAPKDNVVTCCVPVSSGDTIVIGAQIVTASDNIPIYHKMALCPIAAGETVFKYGQPIGIASMDILAGQHVHIQNLESDRGRGDRRKGDTK